MAAPAIHVDAREVVEMFNLAPGRVRKASTDALGKAGLFLEGAMRKAAPHRRGHLRSRIASELTSPTSVEVGVGRASGDGEIPVYALIQHDGGTVTGKPFLAFPPEDSPLRTRSGVGGIRARDVRANPGQFGYTGTFIPKGKSVILGKREDGNLDLLFILKPSVKIKGTRYVEGPFERNREKVFDFLRHAMAQTLEQA